MHSGNGDAAKGVTGKLNEKCESIRKISGETTLKQTTWGNKTFCFWRNETSNDVANTRLLIKLFNFSHESKKYINCKKQNTLNISTCKSRMHIPPLRPNQPLKFDQSAQNCTLLDIIPLNMPNYSIILLFRGTSVEKNKNNPSCNVKESEKKIFLVPPLCPNLHTNMMDSFVPRVPSFHQVWWKSVL